MQIIKPTEEYYHQKSERLQFIPFSEQFINDWSTFFVNNPTERFVGFENSPLSNLEKASNWIKKQMERKSAGEFGQLAVIEKRSGNFIGVGGIISRMLNDKPEYEITYSLLPEFWGLGYATELAKHFKSFMLTQYKCHSLISIIHVENEASKNVAIKNGMYQECEDTYLDMPVFIYRYSNQ